jgi:hypothetical protein
MSLIKYGYSFEKDNAGGLGALIHSMMLAKHYAKLNDHAFVLVEEGKHIFYFNGHHRNADGKDKGWHDYFVPFEYVAEEEIKGGIWVTCPKGWTRQVPGEKKENEAEKEKEEKTEENQEKLETEEKEETEEKTEEKEETKESKLDDSATGAVPLRIQWYSDLCREIYVLQPDILKEIDARIERSGFNAETDLALHVRRTDKIFQMRDYEEKGKKIASNVSDKRESGVVTLEYYLEKTLEVWPESGASRIFLCTDDTEIRAWFKEKFSQHSIPVIWDESENVEGRAMHLLRMNGKLTREQAWEENLVAMTNMEMLIRARYIIGGRMSYFFRVAELIRYPKPSLNIKDSDVFGKSPYAQPGEKVVFPLKIQGKEDDDESLSGSSDDEGDKDEDEDEKSFDSWKVSPEYKTNTTAWDLSQSAINLAYTTPDEELIQQLETKRIIRVRDFLNKAAADIIRQKIPAYRSSWWTHAFMPSITDNILKWDAKHHDATDPICKQRYRVAKSRFDLGEFAYSYHRSESKSHYDACSCFGCTLEKIFLTEECKSALSNLIGKRIVSFNEVFASKYQEGDFLSIHHDKKKGDYTFILSLNDDWNPTHGGLTHFWDAASKEIYMTAVPLFGALTIFKLDDTKQIDHFVSTVVTPKNRYAFTGWIKTEELKPVKAKAGGKGGKKKIKKRKAKARGKGR